MFTEEGGDKAMLAWLRGSTECFILRQKTLGLYYSSSLLSFKSQPLVGDSVSAGDNDNIPKKTLVGSASKQQSMGQITTLLLTDMMQL